MTTKHDAPATPAQPAMPEPVASAMPTDAEIDVALYRVDLIGKIEEVAHAAMGYAQDRNEHTERRLIERKKIALQASAALAAQQCAQLQQTIAGLKTVMIAAAEEIAAHWQAHCDAEGYGPQNLLRRLEEGIPSEYGYTAGAFARERQQREAAEARCAQMVEALHEIAEEWAGAECGEPVHAQEAYAIGLAKRMYSIASAALAAARKGQSL